MIKIIIPLAGKGTRLRPHTHTKPKPLVNVAGKPVLGHILDKLKNLDVEEIVFITGDMEDQVKKYVSKHYDYKTKYIKQTELLGDGHAINMAKDEVSGEVMIIFVDTLFVRDIKNDIETLTQDGIVWTNKTDDPKRFGIVTLKDDVITDIEESQNIQNQTLH
jgi:glucose-1-phosphate thymidylyltransferase